MSLSIFVAKCDFSQEIFVYFIFSSAYWSVFAFITIFPLRFLITELFNGRRRKRTNEKNNNIEIDGINLEQIKTEWKENSRIFFLKE